MGFGTNSYATVWVIKDEGDYYRGQISTSRKNKDGELYTDFSDWVSFLGAAAAKAKDLSEKDRIKILSCAVENSYNKEREKTFYFFKVFDFENAGTTGAKKSTVIIKTERVADVGDGDDEDLPF